MLEHCKLSLLEDGTVITAEGEPQSPSSQVHIVEAGLVAISSAVPSACDSAAQLGNRRDSRDSVLRVQGPGTHVGFAGMALQQPQQTTVTHHQPTALSCIQLDDCATSPPLSCFNR
jgi:hypothetical protein